MSRRIGRVRNLLLFLSLAALTALIIMDAVIPVKLLSFSGYFYLFLTVLFIFFGVYPLYTERRLVRFYWERTKRRRLAIFGLIFLALLVLIAVIGPFLTQDPTEVNFPEKNSPPPGFSISQSIYDRDSGKFTTREVRGSLKHPLGTDDKGRDMLAMLVSGARISLGIGLLATLIAIAIGTLIGVISAYLGGFVDGILMRFTDIMMTFPFFLLLVFVVFIFGPSNVFIILAIGLTGWTGVARIIRSEVLSLRSREFVLAARALGASSLRIIFRHLIPNVISTIIVIATLSIPGVILAEAALSFIGLGDPTVTSWGVILESGYHNLDRAWWIAVEPGIILFLTVLAFNFLGDGVRDAFDPTSEI